MKVVLCSKIVFICLLALFGSGCNRSSYGADDKSKVHVGIVFDIGGKDDRSFNAAAFAGVTFPIHPAALGVSGLPK